MTTILDALQKGTGYLEKHGVESARLNMQHLVAHVLGCDRMNLYVDFDRELAEDDLGKLRGLMKDRAAGVPLQHLLGTVEFLGREFLSDERALVPRPETEFLVDWLARRSWPDRVAIADIGCGSGVIGLSLAAELAAQQAQVTLVDVSPEAISLARENAERLAEALEGTGVRFVESDLFAEVDESFDLIVANLPYVSDADMGSLSAEVAHDPELALRGGPGGVDVMQRFLGQVKSHIADGGLVAMEFGLGQEEVLEAGAREAGFAQVTLMKDLEGRTRFLIAP